MKTKWTVPNKPAFHVLVGPARSGKTHMLRFLMKQYAKQNYFNTGIAFGSLPDFDFMPNKDIKPKLTDEILTEHFNDMGENPKPNFIIIDSQLDSYKNWHSLLARYRHTNTTIFLETQTRLSIILNTHATHVYSWYYKPKSPESYDCMCRMGDNTFQLCAPSVIPPFGYNRRIEMDRFHEYLFRRQLDTYSEESDKLYCEYVLSKTIRFD